MGEGFRRDGRKLSTMFDGTRSRAVRGNGNEEGVNSSPRPRFQDGSLRMQNCEIPYNCSSRRCEILNLGIPLSPRFSLSIPLVPSNLIPRIPLVFLRRLLVPRQPFVLSIRAPLAEASVYLGIHGAPISRAPDWHRDICLFLPRIVWCFALIAILFHSIFFRLITIAATRRCAFVTIMRLLNCPFRDSSIASDARNNVVLFFLKRNNRKTQY